MSTAAWAGELSPLEERAELDSLESLHEQRRQIMPEYAALRALHGSAGKWDNRRKQMLSAIAMRVRMSPCPFPSGKWTDDGVEAAAHADEQYAALVDQGIADATRYVELETIKSEIEEKIRSRELAILAYNAESRLAR